MKSIQDMTLRELHHEGFVCVVFTPEDAQSLRETWDMDKCREQLAANAKYINDRLVELGWDVIDTLLDPEHPPCTIARAAGEALYPDYDIRDDDDYK